VERRIRLSRGIAHLIEQVNLSFPEARVHDYEKLMLRMTNHPKDRHVMAAAVQCGAHVIVTSNLKDFPPESLLNWAIEACHPDAFLLSLYNHSSSEVESRLPDQAAIIGRTLPNCCGR
jgi:hypothetical protein